MLILDHVIDSVQILTQLNTVPTSIVSEIIQKNSLSIFVAHPHSNGEPANSLVKPEAINEKEEALIKWLRLTEFPLSMVVQLVVY